MKRIIQIVSGAKMPILAGFLLLSVGVGSSSAQMRCPAYIGAEARILDEFGAPLVGQASALPAECDRVEILTAADGVIYPPDTEGNPDARNELIVHGLSWIGNLTAPGLTNSGLFGHMIANPVPASGTRLFVRAFNAPTRGQSTFYGNSSVFEILPNDNAVYPVTVASMNPLDPSDPDGDGLLNSWEEDYGTDSNIGDTDGDGMGDWEEVRAGTDPLNLDSLFVMAWVSKVAAQDAIVAWESVPGKRYQVEYTPDDLAQSPVYSNVSSIVTASAPITEATVAGGLMNEGGSYRVRLVE